MAIRIPPSSLLKTVCKCQDCHLYETATNPFIGGRFVNSENHPDIPLMLLCGESPGRHEDSIGACFQHTSLKNLEKALGDYLNQCYLTNVCRCVPWADPCQKYKVRKPTPIEMQSCLPWLLLEISKFPEGTPVVAMGTTAFQALMPSLESVRITEIAGKEFDLVVHNRHYRLFAQVHPASISYNPSLSETFYGTFNKILKSLNKETVDTESEYWEMLDPSKAIQKNNQTKQLYLDKQIKYVITDTETSGFIPWHDRVIMFGLSHTADKKGYSIPLEIQNRFDFPDFPVDLYKIDMNITDHDIQLIKKASRDLFDTVPIVGHNLKFDLKMLAYHDFLNLDKIRVYNDTLLMSAILIGRGWNGESLGLKEMCVKLLGISEGWDWVVDQWIGKYKRVADRTYDNIPTCILGKYCALDHYYTRELHEKLYPIISEHKCKLLVNTFNVATKAYSEAELKGIEIDWDIYDVIKNDSDSFLEYIIKEIKKDPHIKKIMLEKYEEEMRVNETKKRPKDKGFFMNKLENGDYFSLGSVKDKRELIYKRYGVKVFSTTDKGDASCDRATLQAIADNTDNEKLKKLCENFLEYNKFSKLKSTYIDNLPDQCDDNKIYHPEFNIAGTVTGRLSSNFHVLPRKSSIKYLYTSKEHKDSGSIWLSPDMSQLELRVTAGIANEPSWINSYINNEDLHQRTAANMFSKLYEDVTKDERKIGKQENFSLLYGSGAKSQAEKLGVTIEEAEEMLSKYKKTIPNIVNLIHRQENFATQNGYIYNMFNRYMPVPDAQSADKKIKAHGLRESFNYLIQSTDSDIVTTSFARLYLDIKSKKMNTLLY